MLVHPLVILAIGIVTVVGLILVLRLNAFLALIAAAIVVSLLAPGPLPEKISRVAFEFGASAGKIGIVIALAAIIGTCMMDSGAADRIVRAFLRLLGEKRAPIALMGSGFVLAVPVFFDTVFYLLVPLGRSLHKRTGTHYLKYLLAIGAGGAITHTLVPPTPGPLAMAGYLGVDVGWMIMIGALVALPAAIAGLAVGTLIDRLMPVPMRPIGTEPEAEPLADHQLPSLFVAVLPVVLPVLLISANTVLDTWARAEARRLEAQPAAAVVAPADTVNAAEAETPVEPARPTLLRQAADVAALLGDANLALFLATAIAMLIYYQQRKPTLVEMSKMVELSLMSGGVIILITAGGGAFGAMLKVAGVGDAIKQLFSGESGVSGLALLLLGFGVSAVLKIAQGSSTVAMITASGMMAGMASATGSAESVELASVLGFHPVYLATAIGSGSLIGSWMNDSGFWIFAKMGGLTEAEALKSWTPTLIVLGTVGLGVTIVLTQILPLV